MEWTQKMSRPSLTSTVFLKEIRETLRDKRVILGVIVSPLLVTPLLIGTVLFFAGKKEIEKQASIVEVGIVEQAAFPELVKRLKTDEGFNAHQIDSREAAKQAIEDRTIRAALIVRENAQTEFSSNNSAPLEILYNFANENSQFAQARLRNFIGKFDKEALADRIEAASLSENFAEPTKVETTNIAAGSSAGSFVLGLFLPYIIVMSAAFGGIQTAFDLCAGEKERGTMETLLVSPASRYEIVTGKLLTILTISFIASCCAITGIIAPVAFGLEFFKKLVGDSISINFASIVWMMLIVIPLALFTSSLLLVISSFARNQKEAQTYILPFFSVVILPAVLSTVLGAESHIYTAFVPILNISLTMKQILGDLFDPLYFGISLATSFLYAFLAMRLAASFFQREQILFRT